MHNLDDNTITDEVLEQFSEGAPTRLRQVACSLIRHLHEFAREVRLTPQEWKTGIDFLTELGHITDDKRQEFILLSDTLGVSMLVDVINHRVPAGATQTTVLGPFYLDNPPLFEQGADISGDAEGEPLYVDITVKDADCNPVPGATVDVWQSDSEGFYDVQKPDVEGSQLRGRLKTDGEGRLRCWSQLPVAYPIPDDGPVGDMLRATKRHPWRPAHMHFLIAAPGHETLVTHLFVHDSLYLDSDAVFAVKDSLICKFPMHPASEAAPDRRKLDRDWRDLHYTFSLSN